MEVARTKVILASQRQKDNKSHYDAKMHWKNELQKLHDFRKKIPKGSDVVSKLR